MQNLNGTLCIALGMLLAATSAHGTLPTCPGSPVTGPSSDVAAWTDCQGSFTSDKGNIYVGGFKDGKFHGQGDFYDLADTPRQGSKYVGDFKHGKFHGKGTYNLVIARKTSVEKSTYIGTFEDGKMHGKGTYTLENGRKYVGEFQYDMYHGQGTYTWPDGTRYVGGYQYGKYHGQGKLSFPNGKVKEGVFENGVFKYAARGVRTATPKPTPTPQPRHVRPAPQPKPRVAPRPAPRTSKSKLIPVGTGSGFAISKEGHVITNHHVISGCPRVTIHHKGTSYASQVVTFDARNDLALLKGQFTPESYFPLSNTNPKLLQEIYVAGYPFGDKFSTTVKVTKGIVSSLTGLKNNFSHIQIDAALQPGNSGGPILNNKGNVVGVAVAKLSALYVLKTQGVLPENTNFGIKSSVVKTLLESNSLALTQPNTEAIPLPKLGELISTSTYRLVCWMTKAQLKKRKRSK